VVDTATLRIAARAALQARRSLSVPRESPVNPFDIASSLGIDVRFVDAKSLEGMFVKEPGPRIVLPCLTHRPRARIAFSCAHELGHSQLGHGTRVDEYVAGAGSRKHSVEELGANAFAATLLMPRQAVLSAFERRTISPLVATPDDLLRVACELGVGLRTLVGHLMWGLEILPRRKWATYKDLRPKTVREAILGTPVGRDVLIVDEHWTSPPIDLEVGMQVALPSRARVESECLALVAELGQWSLWRGAKSGVGGATWDNTARSVRVARAGYVGPLKHRYWPEEDE